RPSGGCPRRGRVVESPPVPQFEFVVEGPPATVNTKENNTRRYQRWINKVRETARQQWSPGQEPATADAMTVEVTNYYRTPKDRPSPPDVDNVLKPILDGMNGVVYQDDIQVFRVSSDRYDLGIYTPSLLEALARFREFVYVRVIWEDEDR